MDDDAIADPGALADGDVRINQAAGADGRLMPDIAVGADAGAIANPRTRLRRTTWAPMATVFA